MLLVWWNRPLCLPVSFSTSLHSTSFQNISIKIEWIFNLNPFIMYIRSMRRKKLPRRHHKIQNLCCCMYMGPISSSSTVLLFVKLLVPSLLILISVNHMLYGWTSRYSLNWAPHKWTSCWFLCGNEYSESGVWL